MKYWGNSPAIDLCRFFWSKDCLLQHLTCATTKIKGGKNHPISFTENKMKAILLRSICMFLNLLFLPAPLDEYLKNIGLDPTSISLSKEMQKAMLEIMRNLCNKCQAGQGLQ